MPRLLTPGTSVEDLRKEAKRWLKALRAHDVDARARLTLAWPQAPHAPGLRDVQHALALEYGLAGWIALKAAAERIRDQGTSTADALPRLLRAADRGDAVAVGVILDRFPDIIDDRGTLEGHTGLRTALHFGVHSEPVVRLLLERGANPNIRDEGDNAFPLHFAAERGDLTVISLLVEHGAQTVAGEVDDHQLDIIGWATCFPGNETKPEVVEYLLAHGARHTLHSAVAVGDIETIRLRAAENPTTIERPLDKTNRHGRAVHLAVVKRQPQSLATLLELGADPAAIDAGGMTALDEAALGGHTEMATMLISKGAPMALPAAIALQRADEIERLVREDPAALAPGGRWGTLIVHAASQAPGHVIETMIRLGASVDAIEDPATSVDGTHGYTALHAAAFHGNSSAIDVLVKHGANTRIRDSRYCGTPAGWARFARRQEAFECLTAAGIDVFDAIDFDLADRIPEILRRDPQALHRPFGAYLPPAANPRQWCPDPGISPLAYATAENKVAAVRVLVAHGAELAAGGHVARTHEERVAAFLRMACLDWAVGGPERGRLTHAAERLLRRHPDICADSIFTAVVCGDVNTVRRLLEERPERAVEIGGPRQWPPLLYLATARLPAHAPSAGNAPAIARLLLERGADPNAYYHGGNETIHYTVLTSVIGRGEEQASTHPEAKALAALLLAGGAEPYDQQVFYNAFAGHASHRALGDDDLVWLLELIHREALKRGRHADWADPHWEMLQMGGRGGGAWYLLFSALKGNYLTLARWALEHGASANPPSAADPRTPTGTLYDQAQKMGLTEFAALLAQYGALRQPASTKPDENFASVCLRLERKRARAMVSAHPGLLHDGAPLFSAAEYDRADVAELLLDLGMSPDIENRTRARPLHAAAYADARRVARLLIDRGAEIDPRDDMHGTTPVYWAWWGQRPAMVDLLAPLTRDVWTLVPAGKLARLRQVLAEDPDRAKQSWSGGTPLFDLPDDEATAVEIVKLFLAYGADPSHAREDGTTAGRIARARGLDAAATLLGDRLEIRDDQGFGIGDPGCSGIRDRG